MNEAINEGAKTVSEDYTLSNARALAKEMVRFLPTH